MRPSRPQLPGKHETAAVLTGMHVLRRPQSVRVRTSASTSRTLLMCQRAQEINGLGLARNLLQ